MPFCALKQTAQEWSQRAGSRVARWGFLVRRRGSVLCSSGVGVQCIDKCRGIERPQVADLLPYADESHRDLQLVTDPQHDAALGGAVELGEHDARDLHVGLERLGLR